MIHRKIPVRHAGHSLHTEGHPVGRKMHTGMRNKKKCPPERRPWSQTRDPVWGPETLSNRNAAINPETTCRGIILGRRPWTRPIRTGLTKNWNEHWELFMGKVPS